MHKAIPSSKDATAPHDLHLAVSLRLQSPLQGWESEEQLLVEASALATAATASLSNGTLAALVEGSKPCTLHEDQLTLVRGDHPNPRLTTSYWTDFDEGLLKEPEIEPTTQHDRNRNRNRRPGRSPRRTSMAACSGSCSPLKVDQRPLAVMCFLEVCGCYQGSSGSFKGVRVRGSFWG